MKQRGLALLLAGMGAAVGASDPGEAEALYRAGRHGEATAAFLQLAAAQPDHAGVLFHLGKLAIRRGEHAEATGLLERAVALAPREVDYHHWLGNGYAWAAAGAELYDKPALGRKCLAAYRRALELDPDFLPARFGLMNFYRHVPRLLGGGMARARAEAEEIRRRDPVQGAYARALLHGHEQDYAAAFAALAEVLARNPSHYAANSLLGRLALESGERLDEGAAALRRCLELQPADTDEPHAIIATRLSRLIDARPKVAVVRQ